jgi:hypothetical protein
MTTLGEYAARLGSFLAANPDAASLPVVATDDQCCHHELGYPSVHELADWPTEYCLAEHLPPGTTHFVSL